MLMSASTLGPYRFASAARMPSSNSACSSARSNCLVFAISRNALRMSPELTIGHSLSAVRRLPMKGQPSFTNLGQRNTLLFAPRRSNGHDLGIGLTVHADDLHLLTSAERGTQHVRLLPHEAAPVGRALQRALHTGRRHLQHVPLAYGLLRVQPRLDRPRRYGAIIDRDGLAVTAVDPHLQRRSRTR